MCRAIIVFAFYLFSSSLYGMNLEARAWILGGVESELSILQVKNVEFLKDRVTIVLENDSVLHKSRDSGIVFRLERYDGQYLLNYVEEGRPFNGFVMERMNYELSEVISYITANK